MPFTQGQILENEEGQRKVLGVCGEVYFISIDQRFLSATSCLYTEQDLINDGYKPVPKKWVPVVDELIWVVSAFGSISSFSWYGRADYEYAYSIGNCFKTRKQAEAYRQYLLDNPYEPN